MDPRLGFLNTSPENLGTALRASVFVKLPRLGQQPGFNELLDRLRLEASSRFKGKNAYTGIFDIANAERLGQSEVQLINTMINGVGRLIALEKQLERGEKINLKEVR
jgi:creatine kinase